MKEHVIDLTSPEISALWKTYMQDTAILCVMKHFLQYIQDAEITPLIEEQVDFLQNSIEKIKTIFNGEGFPIPIGFSDEDVNQSAPPLYTGLFGLSLMYRFNQMALSEYATTATKVLAKT